MGLMGFVNLAHGVFAMAGGYLTTSLMKRLDAPFPLALLAAAALVALVSVALERLLYRRLYGGDELDQVLLTMGLVFMSIGGATFVWGPLQQPLQLPPQLSGWQVDFGFRSFPYSQLSDPLQCRTGDGIVAGGRAYPLWRPGARRSRQSAHGAIGRIDTSSLFMATFALAADWPHWVAGWAPIC